MITIDGQSLTGRRLRLDGALEPLSIGDILDIEGRTQRHVVTAICATEGGKVEVEVYPQLESAPPDRANVSIVKAMGYAPLQMLVFDAEGRGRSMGPREAFRELAGAPPREAPHLNSFYGGQRMKRVEF